MVPAKRPTDGRSRLPLLLGLAIALAGLYAWDQWAGWGIGSAPPGSGAGAPDKAGAKTGDLGDGPDHADEPKGVHPLADLALSDLRDTVRRPLFEKGRRPVAPPKPPAPTVRPTAPIPRQTADPKALTLLGVLMTEGGNAIALLRRNQTGQNVRLQEGETVDGWTIERIEPEAVVLKQGDAQIALKLFRKQ